MIKVKVINEDTIECRVLEYGKSPFTGNTYTPQNTEAALLKYVDKCIAGEAYGEFGFPALPDGITEEDYAKRHNLVDPENRCLRIDHLWNAEDGIYARIQFDGPKAGEFAKLVSDTDSKWRLAMRSWTIPGNDGTMETIAEVIAFDVSTNMAPNECPNPPQTA